MNLRLDQDVRLRFSESEAVTLEKGDVLTQEFSLIEGLSLEVIVQLSDTSKFYQESINRVLLHISHSDFAKLRNEDKKQGLEVGPWILQIDLMKRRKPEGGGRY